VKIPSAPHPWNLTPRQAIAVQRRLAGLVVPAGPGRAIRFVAGLDAAFSADGQHCIAGVVLWDTHERCVVEETHALRPLRFPYVPGLLSFRETPALIAGLRKLKRAPDALMCDGHGVAHPRRFGIACHIGLLAGIPAIGCGKSILVGEHKAPGSRRGSKAALVDRGEAVGFALRTQAGVRPVFVSIGHRFGLAAATRLVLACATKYRLPEPTRLADQLVARIKLTRTPS
jgi:deoxyribonuclease V